MEHGKSECLKWIFYLKLEYYLAASFMCYINDVKMSSGTKSKSSYILKRLRYGKQCVHV